MAAGASAGCILRLRGGNWEYGVERKFVRGHYDPHGSEFQVDLVATANAGSRRRIVVVADGEIIQPKSSSSLMSTMPTDADRRGAVCADLCADRQILTRDRNQ